MTTTSVFPEQETRSPRLRRFLAASRQRGAKQPPARFVADLAAAFDQYADRPLRERQKLAWVGAFDKLPVYLFPDEQLVGMVYHLGQGPKVAHPLNWSVLTAERTRQEFPENAELAELEVYSDGAAAGHVTWHWDWLLEKGVVQMLREYKDALSDAADSDAATLYSGVIGLLEALLRWNDRHVATLEKTYLDADPEDRPRLRKLLALCRRVPAHPARTFHEAVQSFYFQYLAVMRENPHGGNGPGRLDYFLWPYLEKDLAAGDYTLGQARELIDELFIRIDERIQKADTWVETIVVGGTHPDGTSAVNPLTTIMVESIMALDQTHPSVYLRIPDDAPEALTTLATRYLLEGQNRAQILSDRAVVTAMRHYGMPEEDARMYTCGGCMEIVPQGMNSDMLFTGRVNIPKLLELCLTGGRCLRTGRRLAAVELRPLPAYTHFEDFHAAFVNELERALRVMFGRLDIGSEAMAQCRPVYLLSSMTADCFERGRELHDGGARYHDYGVAPLGIANAGDALYAVKRAVYDDRFCTPDELLEAMAVDFEGFEALRLRLRALPKFGQQHDGADAMTNRVLETVCRLFGGHKNRWDGRVKPMIFTHVWAPTTGAALGATADGQHAGKPIAHGLTPQRAGMTSGITAAIGSHASLSLDRIAGASTTMWDLDPHWATPETTKAILTTFLGLGGHIFQGNTTDIAALVKARETPEDYPDLMVRVGGFSAKFVALDPALQDDIINRYRHKA